MNLRSQPDDRKTGQSPLNDSHGGYPSVARYWYFSRLERCDLQYPLLLAALQIFSRVWATM